MRRLAGFGHAGGEIGRSILRRNGRGGAVDRVPEVKMAARHGDLQNKRQKNKGNKRTRAATATQQIPQPMKPRLHRIRLHAHSPTPQPRCGEIVPTIP